MCCRKLSEFHANIDIETKQLDNILRDLRNYYHTVKTKRQLGLEIPAGFRRESVHKKEFTLHSPLRKSSLLPADNLEVLSDSSEILDNNDSCEVPSIPEIHSGLELALSPATPITAQSSLPNHTPLIRPVDKVSSSLPKTMLMTEDFLHACVGFHRADTLRKQFKHLYQDTVRFDQSQPDAILDAGCFASLRKKDRNTVPVPHPQQFGDVFHMDIVFSPEISVGNIHYSLRCVDRYSQMTYLYPLHNLTSDIQKQLELFFSHLGSIPRRIISDFDMKLLVERQEST